VGDSRVEIQLEKRDMPHSFIQIIVPLHYALTVVRDGCRNWLRADKIVRGDSIEEHRIVPEPSVSVYRVLKVKIYNI
jgi:hypothetical protein